MFVFKQITLFYERISAAAAAVDNMQKLGKQ